MRAPTSSAIAGTILLGILIVSRQLEAQETVAGASRERGCRGDQMTVSMDAIFHTIAALPVITVVPPGTPAALAGLQVGDSIVSVAGRDSRETPKGERPFFAPGDSLRLTVRRQQADVPIVIVFGHMVEEGGDAAARVCRPIASPSNRH